MKFFFWEGGYSGTSTSIHFVVADGSVYLTLTGFNNPVQIAKLRLFGPTEVNEAIGTSCLHLFCKKFEVTIRI